MKLSKKINGVISKAYNKTKQVASKMAKPVKKYAPAVMIALNSVGSLKAAPKGSLVDKKIDATTITSTPKAFEGKFTFNNMNFDVATMHVEDINVLFISGNNSAAMYGGNTMKTVKDFGPMLNKMSDLQKVIQAHPEKYADLIEAINKYGIRSDEFKNLMAEKYNDETKRRELTGDITNDLWEKYYQPVFDANSKVGYPVVTNETKNNPETFGYVASVISCMGQSSRQTPEIYKEAVQRAKAQLGNKATLDDYVDISYDVRHERWGLDKRYFGEDGKSGEKGLNKKVREMLAAMENSENDNRTISFDEAFLIPSVNMVNQTDAIKVPQADSIGIREKYAVKEEVNLPSGDQKTSLLETILTRNDEVNLPPLNPESMGVFLQGLDLSMGQPEQLLEERDKEAAELEILHKKVEDISKEDFSFIGKKMVIDYEEMARNPEIIGHYYESGRNPVIKDSKRIQTTTAMGLYQFNMKNTMKVLADKLADEFPLLKKAKDAHGVKSNQYEEAWNFYSLGDDHERFEKRQFKLMFDEVAGASYKGNFDWMTKHCNAPEITMENYNNPELCVYTGSMMSASNQNPYWAKFFAKKAYERVKSRSKTGEVDWNEVGIVLNDIKAERWGKKSKALYRRYMGTKHNIGEKQMCEHLNRYVKEMPKLRAQIVEREKRIQHLDYALNILEKQGWDYMADNSVGKDDVDIAAKTQAIQANKDKFMKIKVHARNMREWHKVKQMAAKNSNIEVAAVTKSVSRKSNSNAGRRRA